MENDQDELLTAPKGDAGNWQKFILRIYSSLRSRLDRLNSKIENHVHAPDGTASGNYVGVWNLEKGEASF